MAAQKLVRFFTVEGDTPNPTIHNLTSLNLSLKDDLIIIVGACLPHTDRRRKLPELMPGGETGKSPPHASEVSHVHNIKAPRDLGVDRLFHIFLPQSLINYGRSETCQILL